MPSPLESISRAVRSGTRTARDAVEEYLELGTVRDRGLGSTCMNAPDRLEYRNRYRRGRIRTGVSPAFGTDRLIPRLLRKRPGEPLHAWRE